MQRIRFRQLRQGQALIEYVLILVLVAIAFGFALAATGPVVGNVFSNTVYNLLGEEPDVRNTERPADFWLTVTWVAENPQQERPLPTNTLPPPSSTPTPGSPPPPTPVTPSRTPVPTSTPRPTATPTDIGLLAPHIDTVDKPEHWRIGAEVFLGTSDWVGEYYVGMNLSGEPTYTGTNVALLCPLAPDTCRGKLNFNWGNDGPFAAWPAGNPGNNFSVRYTREIYYDNFNADETPGAPVNVIFNVRHDDRVRVWVVPEGQTKNDGNRVLDRWFDGNNVSSAPATILPGKSTIIVEYAENSGGALLSVDVNIKSNEDDGQTTDGNTVNPAVAQCNWGRTDRERDANSFDFYWEEYVGTYDDFARNMRCHLEFRGFVEVPADGQVGSDGELMPRPEFVFWHTWDLGDTNKRAWLEVAEYRNLPISNQIVDRAALNWIRVDLQNGAARNFNWTRQVIDLTDVRRDGATTIDDNFIGKRVTFRFVMQNLNSDNARSWYIDDVEFRNGANPAEDFLPGTKLTMNEPNVEAQFITSGHWNLNANKALPDFDNPSNPQSCCSWELTGKNGGAYERFSDGDGGGNTPYQITRQRVHYLELDGFINFDPSLPDDRGDTGAPLLEFYHSYSLGRRTGLEVQYTTDPYNAPNVNWQVVPGTAANAPYGRIRDVNDQTDTSTAPQNLQSALTLQQISLAEIPATRFRLRFAMIVHKDANRRQGWWIDNIYLHREDPPRFLDYPFEDSAEIGMDNWLASGTWYRTNLDARTGDHAFTDSPGQGVQYAGNSDTNLRFIYPIDLNNDTPDNLALTDRNAAGGNSGGAAVDPVLTFWHWRDLNQLANFHVEWRRMNQTDNDWKLLWAYMDSMNTRPADTNNRSRSQLAWEFVHIELAPLLNTFSADPAILDDDDILIRFRLDVNSSSIQDGVYFDDVRLVERDPERAYKLWPTSENRTINGVNYGAGSGSTFGTDGDEPEWFENWRVGGDWQDISWEQRNGLRAFHDSPVEQSTANNGDPNWSTQKVRDNTYNILEMTTIIDLRAARVEDKPTLYFWSRYHVGDDDNISVQISVEQPFTEANLASEMNTRCKSSALPQCYDQLRGWSEWIDTNNTNNWPWYRPEWQRTYTWQRQQVDLSDYASPNANTPGQRIRIRFVSNALDRDNNTDGWYIDDVTVGPLQDQVVRALREGAFSDPARNTRNWVTEGFWGLSPELFRGSGGGPATLGAWREYFWDCATCESLAPGGTSGSNRMRVGSDIFLDGAANNTAAATRTVLDINYDIRQNAPRPGVFNKTDYFVGRWVLDTPTVGPSSGVRDGDYTFITVSDDGVRMKYEILNANGTTTPIGGAPANDAAEWNVIYNWTDHGRTSDMGVVTLQTGNRYRITLEWYEKNSDAVLTLSTGGSSFSFTDTPKQGAGTAFPDIPAVPYSDPSLILNGTLDLAGTRNPVIEYYTYYESYDTLRVEVSTDGGFTWTENGLQSSITYPTGAVENFDDPSYSGDWMPNDGPWQRRRHNLTAYADQGTAPNVDPGEQIMVRFRFDNDSRGNVQESRDNNNNFFTGWWVVDIRIGQ